MYHREFFVGIICITDEFIPTEVGYICNAKSTFDILRGEKRYVEKGTEEKRGNITVTYYDF